MPMIRAMAQIEQDISDIEQEVVAIAQELSETYDEYLIVLGEFVQRQLILSSYHLCTQGYPAQFLKLSAEQRRTLQQSLQRIAQKSHKDLLHPSRLEELTRPFASDLDGIDVPNDDNEDATLKKLTAIVRRVMGEDKKRTEDGPRDSEDRSLDIAFESDYDSDERSVSDDLNALVIPEDLDDDFLRDTQLKISEFSFEELAEDADEEADWDEDFDDDHVDENASDFDVSEDSLYNDESSGDSVTKDTGSDSATEREMDDTDVEKDVNQTDSLETSPDASTLVEANLESDIVFDTKVNDDSDDDSASNQTTTVPPLPLPDGVVGGSSSTVPPTLDFGVVEDVPAIAPPPPVPVSPTPKALARRCDRLETQVDSMLKQASSRINTQLKKSGVLPRKLPNSVLQAAMKADLSTDMQDSPPNILNLLVETGNNQESAKLMRVMAIRLRLAELEFNSPTLMAWRSRIRELAAQLHKLAQNYKRLQQELSVAEAEAAWRSTWCELEE